MTAREIKRLRESLKMTQEEFAALLGAKSETVCRWERGHHPVSAPYLRVIALLRDSGQLRASA